MLKIVLKCVLNVNRQQNPHIYNYRQEGFHWDPFQIDISRRTTKKHWQPIRIHPALKSSCIWSSRWYNCSKLTININKHPVSFYNIRGMTVFNISWPTRCLHFLTLINILCFKYDKAEIHAENKKYFSIHENDEKNCSNLFAKAFSK